MSTLSPFEFVDRLLLVNHTEIITGDRYLTNEIRPMPRSL